MSEYSLDDFFRDHPFAPDEGVNRLYRVRSIDWTKESHIDDLLINGKLYHAKPAQLNDPFECQPHYQWPTNAKDAAALRRHLINIIRREAGVSYMEAQRIIGAQMSNPSSTSQLLKQGGIETFGELRICSFASAPDNLLMWSHYGDSHRGYCLEFDTQWLPLAMAYKVQYSNQYPVAVYPPYQDIRNVQPALIKSPDWAYEEEYRTILVPSSAKSLPNDGESYYLPAECLAGLYFGVNTTENDKKKILEKVGQGPFNPIIYDAERSQSTFKITFKARTT